MKQKLRNLMVVSTAIVGCWSGNAWAQDLANGSYYIKNVKTGQFLVAGNSWGTQASLGRHGIDFILNKVGDEMYTLDSQISNGGNNHYLGSNGYVDGTAANMIIAGDGNGVYTITADGSTFLSSNADNTVVAFDATADSEYAQWQFLTREEMFALLDDATSENPVDATFFVKGQNFGRNDTRNSAWTGSPTIGGAVENMCAERYNMAFDVYQNVTGVPAGKYKLYCQGFFRYGFPAAALTAHIGATEVLETKLYANDSEVPLMSIFNEEALKAILDDGITRGGWSTGTIDGVEYKYPNDMESASAAFSAGLYQTSLDVVVGETGAIKMGFKKETTNVPNGNWTIFDNFEIYYLGLDDDAIAAAKTAMANLQNEAKALYDSPMEAGVLAQLKAQVSASELANAPKPSEIATKTANLNDAIVTAKSSITAYEQLKVVMDDYSNTFQSLNKDGNEAVENYETLYENLVQQYMEGNIALADIDAKIVLLNEALVAVVKAQTAENSDMTLAIVNPSFETGNLNDGWTLTGTPGSSVDNGVKPNSNGTYTTAGCDGDYLLNVWNTGLALQQTITDMPNGVYQLTVACANTGATYKLMGKEVGTPEGNDARKFVDQTCEFAVSNNQIDLLLETVDNVWYKVDNFRLTYLGEVNVDYTALEKAVAGISCELGFAEGQYAPYNNIEAISVLAEAKALLTNKDAFEQETVDNCVTALTNATWTANTVEVNAVYDGNFAIQEAHETSGDLVLSGWDNSDDGMRQLVKNTTENPGLLGASAQAAVFTWPGAHSYGKAEGYTMPLHANTVYELSVKFAGWDGGNNGFSVSVLNDANEGLAMTDLGNASTGIKSANSLVSGKVRFVTGEAGDYVLTVNANGNSTFTDIELLTAKAEDIAVKVSAEYGTMILPFDAEIPSDMEVYSVNSCSEQTEEYSVLSLQPVTDKIAANTPYIVKSDATDFTFNGIVLSNGNAYTDGWLTGVMTATAAPLGSYVLQNQSGKLGFYLVETDDITVPANRAYLTIPETSAANVRAFVFDLGNVTGINHVEAADALVNVYSIDGVPVRKAVKASEALNGLRKGVYVVNGVKKAVK